MIESVLPALFLFVPGIVLFHFPGFRLVAGLSTLEKIVVGSLVWSSLFVLVGYVMSVFTYSVEEFFGAFVVLSILVLGYGAYEGFRRIGRVRLAVSLNLEDAGFAVILAVLSLFILALVLAHSIYQEYDALFYYLPLAKSILLTGGLQSDFFHQTVLTTAIEPSVPLMLAFAGFVSGGGSQMASAGRLIPFAYILLTAGAVYLVGKEISRTNLAGLAAAGIFLAFPATSTMAANFGYYLDIPFVFLLTVILYATLKLHSPGQDGALWWGVLGLSMVAGMFERDIMFFLFPAVAAVVLLLVRSKGAKASVPTAIVLSLVFAGAYNLFFLYDIESSGLSLGAVTAREAPVVVVMALFFIASRKPLRGISAPKARTMLLAAIPFAALILLLGRNVVETGSITSNLPVFHSSWKEALALLSKAGRPSAPVTDLGQLFRWDTLFSNLQLGAVFLIPIAAGLVAMAARLVRRTTETEERTRLFIFVSFLLALLLLWSWVFGSSSAGPEVRRLYYFAPFFGVAAGIGLVATADRLGIGSTRLRIPAFIAVAVSYFWYQEVGAGWSLAKVASALGSLGTVGLSLVAPLAAVFVLAFSPIALSRGPAGRTPPAKGVGAAPALAILAIVAAGSFVGYNSAVILSNSSQTSTLAPNGWENGLAAVTQYLNTQQDNSHGVITTYALPLAYLTQHPVIESTTYFGVISLLGLNSSSGPSQDGLLDAGIQYLLVPTQGNNFYNFSQKMGQSLSVMNRGFFEQVPNMVLIQSFSRYNLYEVVSNQNLSSKYSYLTNFTSGWLPLDASSRMSPASHGVTVSGGAPANLSLPEDSQASFWTPASASSSDHVSVSDDPSRVVSGTSSLKISLAGIGNMVIDHHYTTPQDWGDYSILSMYFYGANTTKSVTLTFHTNGWTDYFATSFEDNFFGWKLLRFPLDSFIRYGSPSWKSISFTEFLMGDRTANYWLGDVSLGGLRLGVSGFIPPMTSAGERDLVVSVGGGSAGIPPILELTTNNATEAFVLKPGPNFVTLPSWFLTNGASVEVFEPALSGVSSATFYYLGVLGTQGG